jgi:hypothetical protein
MGCQIYLTLDNNRSSLFAYIVLMDYETGEEDRCKCLSVSLLPDKMSESGKVGGNAGG